MIGLLSALHAWRARRARAAARRAEAERHAAEAQDCLRISAQLFAQAHVREGAERMRLLFAGYALVERSEEHRARAGWDEREAQRRKQLADWLGMIARQYDVTPINGPAREQPLQVVR